MRSGIISTRSGWTAALAAALILAVAAGAPPAAAQTAEGQPQDLQFEVVNATTSEPGTVDRMTIEYITARRNGVADFEPDGSAFTALGVPVISNGKYIVTVWKGGVPYWWSKRGRELMEGPVVLHVFDNVSGLEGVSLAGMNLVLRHQETLLSLEYMMQVMNEAKPQVTVSGSGATFEIALPDGATEVTASYMRGPDPTDIPVNISGTTCGLTVPLTPGANQIRIQAVVPWTEGMELPVGSDLPVTAWSVLASPEWLEIGSTDIEENDEGKVEGFRRFVGFPLDAGQIIDLRLDSGEHGAGPEEDLFTRKAPAETDAAAGGEPQEKASASRLPLIFLGVVIIVILIAVRRRRS